MFLPLITIAINHNTNALIERLINKANTCLSCDKFGYISRMMLVDKNEVIHFQ